MRAEKPAKHKNQEQESNKVYKCFVAFNKECKEENEPGARWQKHAGDYVDVDGITRNAFGQQVCWY